MVAGARREPFPQPSPRWRSGRGCRLPEHSRDYRATDLLIAGLCLVVALALQVGVNYANDYSDGVRGTDEARVGPVRLVGSSLVARISFGGQLSCASRLLVPPVWPLVAISGLWWLLPIGLAAVAAAWFYTGGPRPYGYAGLGELFVFVFFGLVAVAGTAAVLIGSLTLLGVVAGVPVGMLACALLVVNNLRDIDTDLPAGKRTLATRIGDQRTRVLYLSLIWLPFVIALVLTIAGLVSDTWPEFAALPIIIVPLAAAPARAVRNHATGPALVTVPGDGPGTPGVQPALRDRADLSAP